jgi:hypothetical protein
MGIDLRGAHKHSSKHREEMRNSDLCGCFYCEKIFPPSEIVEWVDNGGTALCPYCGIDSLIGSASGFQLTKEFLHGMCEHWFS